MKKLTDKVALVTGASRGIGLGIAKALASEGAKLAISARASEQLEEAGRQLTALGAEVIVLPADVTVESELLEVFEKLKAHYGRLDLLVNNAGAFDGGPLDELTTEAWKWVVDVNLTAPFICSREAMKIMKPQGGGRIINIGSISGQRVRPGSAAYGATKHGIWGLTQATALDGRPFGITCCCLHPGNVAVERRATAKNEDQEPMMSVEDISSVALLMATLPPHVEMLESIVLPHEQLYVGRG